MYTDMINSDVKFDIIDSVRTLGKETRDTLSLFYAVTRFTIVSSLFCKGKCKTWDGWQQNEQKELLAKVFH